MDFDFIVYILLIVGYLIFNLFSGKLLKKTEREDDGKQTKEEPYDPFDFETEESIEEVQTEEAYDPFSDRRSEAEKHPQPQRTTTSTPEPEKRQAAKNPFEDYTGKVEDLKAERLPGSIDIGNQFKSKPIKSKKPRTRRPKKTSVIQSGKKSKFRFNPLEAVIYSEIINRPKY
jgi:hypothetical protein